MIKMSELIPVMEKAFQDDKTFTFPVNGRSMRPFLKNGDLVTVSQIKMLKKGDVVLYKRDNGSYVLHRIKSIKNSIIKCYGDNQLKYELINKDAIIAIMISRTRKGKEKIVNNNFSFYKFLVKFKFIRLLLKVCF